MGVQTLWGTRVRGIDEGEVSLDSGKVRCRWIIGADGQNSFVRKWAGLDRGHPQETRFGFRQHFRVAPWTDFVEVHWGCNCRIVLTPVSPDEICLVVTSPTPQLRLKEALTHFPEITRRLEGCPAVTKDLGAISALRIIRSVCRDHFALVGDASIGADLSVPETGAVNTFQIGDTLTHVFGTHTLSYGIDFRSVQRGNFTVDNDYRGEFGFTGFVTSGLGQVNSQDQAGIAGLMGLPCAGTGTCQFGNSVADALLGLPQYWLNGFQEYISGAFGEYDFFVQDDWRVRPHLTLNLGLRYEYKSLVTEKNNEFSNLDFSNGDLMVAGTSAAALWSFNPTVNPNTGQYQIDPQPCTAQTCAQQTLNLGSTASNRSLQYPDRKDFEPRIGIAWQPFENSKTVLRGGYGIFFDQTFGDVYFQKAANPPFVHLEEGNIGEALPLLESGTFYPGSGAIIQNALTNIGGTGYPSISPFQLNFRNAFIQEWSADVQRQIGSTWLIDIGYVGTRGLHLVQESDPNQPLNLTSTPVAAQASTLAACQAGSCPAPIPYLANFAYTQSAGSSIYHALQAKVERRFSKGLSILASYTYSKSIDTASGPFYDSRDANFPQNSYDVAAEKAVSDFNFPQRLSLAYLWTMPFGSAAAKAHDPRLNYMIQGWEVGSVLTVESGPPFTSRGKREHQRRG